MRPLTVIVLCFIGLTSQLEEGPQLFARIRQHLRPSIVELPNYTCLETVDRTNYAPNGKMEFRERLRVDILVADQKELFAWPGSEAFTPKPLEDWVRSGAMFNGSFWIHLYNLFETSAASVTYVGRETALQRFSFHTSSLSSRYTLNIQGKSAITAYSGSLWVDSDSLDLVRLETYAEEIPPSLDCREDHMSVTYGRVNLDVGARLLPSVAELKIVSRDGHESDNKVVFSQCHHYTTDTKLSFDVSASRLAAPTASAPTSLELPPDVALVLRLEQPITLKDSAAGDPIVARLDKAVNKAGIRLPKGTMVLGRIRRLEYHMEGRQTWTLVALEFFSAQGPEGEIKFKAHLTGPRASPAETIMVKNVPEIFSGTSGLNIEESGAQSGVGSFRVEGEGLNLSHGFRTIWETH